MRKCCKSVEFQPRYVTFVPVNVLLYVNRFNVDYQRSLYIGNCGCFRSYCALAWVSCVAMNLFNVQYDA
jgi:hypothetical protein